MTVNCEELMAEHQNAPEGTPSSAGAGAPPNPTDTGPMINILSQYTKDLSFENPGSRAGNQVQPDIEIGIDVGATAHEDGNGIYEVSLRIQGKASTAETTVFMIELDYAGVFRLQGFKPEEMEAVLLIECPRLIFPFARRILADITASGGFPPLLIEPVDFRGLYLTQKQRQMAQQAPKQSPVVNTGPMAAATPPKDA